MFELIDNIPQSAVIKVLGVGGGGNAVHHMITNQVDGVDFICANTDSQALNNLKAKTICRWAPVSPKDWEQELTRRSGDRLLGRSRPDRRHSERCGYGVHHCRHGRRYRYRCRADCC